MDDLARFYEVVENPAEYAREWKRTHDGRVVGHFCSYTPEEIIVAAGALPLSDIRFRAPVSKADAHLQAYACSLVRGALEDALSGALDFLDGAVFPHTCDSIQRLSDIWRINGRFGFHLDVVMPAKLDTDSARQYMTRVVGTFATTASKSPGGRDRPAQDLAAAVGHLQPPARKARAAVCPQKPATRGDQRAGSEHGRQGRHGHGPVGIRRTGLTRVAARFEAQAPAADSGAETPGALRRPVQPAGHLPGHRRRGRSGGLG